MKSHTDKICMRALYDGMGLAADGVRQNIDSLSRVSDVEFIHAWEAGVPSLICVSQKNGLREGFGITPMKKKGSNISVRCGFDGYNSIRTKRWPNGQPNQMVAGSCESGSTAMIKQPFIRPAYERLYLDIQRRMRKTAKAEIKKILEE